MKKYWKTIMAVLVLALMFLNCQREVKVSTTTSVTKNATPMDIDRLSWLEGRWEAQNSQGIMIETWTREHDTLLRGEALIIADKDTVFKEDMELIQHQGKLQYHARVNGEPEVQFTYNPADTSLYRFENPYHEAPSVIEYCKPRGDTLEASIYHKNGEKMETFVLIRTR